MAFIVFEGIDGSGKSTLIEGLRGELQSQSKPHVITREPGGTKLAENLRELLIQKGDEPPVPRAELLLYQAARAQHVDKVIAPALKDGKWVLCDRFTFSSLAFQAGGRGVDEEAITWLNKFSTTNLAIDLVVLMDLPVEESLRRRENRSVKCGVEQDRFELENQNFHQNVRNHYLKQFSTAQQGWLKLNAMKSPEELLEELIRYLQKNNWLDQ